MHCYLDIYQEKNVYSLANKYLSISRRTAETARKIREIYNWIRDKPPPPKRRRRRRGGDKDERGSPQGEDGHRSKVGTRTKDPYFSPGIEKTSSLDDSTFAVRAYCQKYTERIRQTSLGKAAQSKKISQTLFSYKLSHFLRWCVFLKNQQ